AVAAWPRRQRFPRAASSCCPIPGGYLTGCTGAIRSSLWPARPVPPLAWLGLDLINSGIRAALHVVGGLVTSGRLPRPRVGGHLTDHFRDRGDPRRCAGRARPPHTGGRGMTADLPLRLGEIGTVLATRMLRVFDATLALLETVSPVLDVAGAGRYEIHSPIGHGGHAEVLLGIVRDADGFERPVA